MKRLLFVLLAPSIVMAESLLEKSRIWGIEPLNKGSICWCIIRDFDSPESVYHIEVVCKASGHPPWKIEKTAPHIAISSKALERSIRKPRKKGDVYPEQYEEQKKKWYEMKSNGLQPKVCRETIRDCILKPKEYELPR